MSDKDIEILFNGNYKALIYFAASILPSGCLDEAHDCVSQAFVDLKHKDISSIDNEIQYLYGMVKRNVFTHLKKTKRFIYSENIRLDWNDSAEEYADAKAIKSEILADLSKKYKSLHPRRRMVFDFMYLDGLDVREIAAKMNISEHTVRHVKKFIVNLFGIFPRKAYVINTNKTDIILSKRYRQ